MAKTPKKQRKTGGAAERHRATLIDDLAEFEQYRMEVLDKIRADLRAGLGSDEIVAKYKDQVVARQITIALTEPDAGKANAAIQDIRNRDEGKPVTRVDETHRFEGMEEDQLDALILSTVKKAKKLDDDEDELTKH